MMASDSAINDDDGVSTSSSSDTSCKSRFSASLVSLYKPTAPNPDVTSNSINIESAFEALRLGQLRDLKNLFEAGFDPSTSWEYADCKAALIDEPDLNLQEGKWTMVKIATYNGHQKLIGLLLDAAPTPMRLDDVLVVAVTRDYLAAFDILIEGTDERFEQVYPAAVTAIDIGKPEALTALLRCLLEYPTRFLCSFVGLAVKGGNLILLDALINECARSITEDSKKKRPSYNQRPSDLQHLLETVLTTAAERNQPQMVEWAASLYATSGIDEVLKFDSEWEKKALTGALEGAAKGGRFSIIQLLLPRWGAKVDFESVLRKAAAEDRKDIVEYLLVQAGHAPASPKVELLNLVLVEAARSGAIETVEGMVELGAQLAIVGKRALELAAASGELDVVEYLVQLGCWKRQRGKFVAARSPLVSAAEKGWLPVVKYLLIQRRLMRTDNAGNLIKRHPVAYPQELDDAFETAARYGHLHILDVLIADNGEEDLLGSTALRMAAVGSKNMEVVNRILKSKDTLSITEDDMDQLLVDVAGHWFHHNGGEGRSAMLEIMRYLLIAGASVTRCKTGGKRPDGRPRNTYEYLEEPDGKPIYKHEYLEEPLLQLKIGLPEQLPEARNPKRIEDWECKDGKQEHTFFISYRASSDSQVAKAFKEKLQEMNSEAHVFLDQDCLVNWEGWEEGFMQGLLRSKVIILLCSGSALKKVEWAHLEPDYMFLEKLKEEVHRIASLAVEEAVKIERTRPDETTTTIESSLAFLDQNISRLPDLAACAAVKMRLDNLTQSLAERTFMLSTRQEQESIPDKVCAPGVAPGDVWDEERGVGGGVGDFGEPERGVWKEGVSGDAFGGMVGEGERVGGKSAAAGEEVVDEVGGEGLVRGEVNA
ncbi:hypothetical protein HDV00_002447 [Rhizophlyctis rosea]|nr:hypothetical protein HDV00_002447 [Rhizophlyctis rosea]